MKGLVEAQAQHLGPFGERVPPAVQRPGVGEPESSRLDHPQAGVPGIDLVDGLQALDDAAKENVLVDPAVGTCRGQHPVVGHGDGLQPEPTNSR